jgi:hypothetical protein
VPAYDYSTALYTANLSISVSCSSSANIAVNAVAFGTPLNVNIGNRVNETVYHSECLGQYSCVANVQWVGQLPSPTDAAVPACVIGTATAVAVVDVGSAQQLAAEHPSFECDQSRTPIASSGDLTNSALAIGSQLGLPGIPVWLDLGNDSAEIGSGDDDSVVVGNTGGVVCLSTCTLSNGYPVPSDAYVVRQLYYNGINGRYIPMRWGYYDAKNDRGFGFRKLVYKNNRWARYGEKLETTLRWGYRYGTAYPSSSAQYYWCDRNTNMTYKVVVNETPTENMKGVITGYVYSQPGD